MAPLDIVLDLNNIYGVIGPGLDHLTHGDHGVFNRVILKDVIVISDPCITIATCNYYARLIYGL